MVSFETVVYVFVFTFIGSILSLLGGLVLIRGRLWEGEHAVHLLAFSGGVLLATAFLDLLPEALKEAGDAGSDIFIAALLGVLVFFFLERFLLAFHPHDHNADVVEARGETLVALVLFGDGIHNFIDGFVIAGSFLVSFPVGLTTTLAVAAHEIPQEISDFSILLRRMGASRAIWLNLLSGLTAMVGAAIALAVSGAIEEHLDLTLAFTAGMFVYISASNILPELQHVYVRERTWHEAVFLSAGVALTALLVLVLHLG